jgi:carbon-monoxide dehydrogenase large subunit
LNGTVTARGQERARPPIPSTPRRQTVDPCNKVGVFTNTVPVDAYRGAGRPEACYVVERLVDTAAREMGIDPGELRRRNFIAKDAYPYQTPVALTYDSGDYFTTLEMALKAADHSGFEQRRQESAR